MTVRRKKRPRDPLPLGKLIVDIATGTTEQAWNGGDMVAMMRVTNLLTT